MSQGEIRSFGRIRWARNQVGSAAMSSGAVQEGGSERGEGLHLDLGEAMI